MNDPMTKKMKIMKRINSLQPLWIICVVLISGLLIPACDSGDDLDTNQYTGGVNLNVFGPSPVARGGELRFLGSGLNQVTGVLIPGAAEITAITVISETEIRISVPQTAEVGYVVLHTPKGDITTKTPLTYSEPVSLQSVSPSSIKPGEVLTITGEYLNLVHEVIFTEEVIVSEEAFIKHQREEIQLKVPAEARSGKIIISDAAELPNWIYSEDELVVVLPSVDAVADLTGKKPGDLIEIAGKDLDLVERLQMPNGDEVEFEVKSTAEGETISFALPENMTSGAVVMIAASGVEIAIANVNMALPSAVVATPAAGLRAGDEIILTGDNMELVTDITFPGVEEGVVPTSQTEAEVKVAMPAAAISGKLLLHTASGGSVEVPVETQKPLFSAYESDALPLGNDVVISGNHLDLVVKVLFTGGGEVEVSAESPTKLTASMPSMDVETGALTLYMANGESVEFPQLTIEAPEFAYIPVLPDEEDEPRKGGTVMSIGVANGEKLTGVQVDGADVQYILNENTLYFEIPPMANANSKVTLISSNGEVTYDIAFIPAIGGETTVWSGPVTITWGEGGRVVIPASAFSGVRAGAKMRFYFDQIDQTWAQAQINDGSWSALVFDEVGGQTLIPTDVYGWEFDSRVFEVTLTRAILDQIEAKKGASDGDYPGAGIVIQGENLIFNKVTIE